MGKGIDMARAEAPLHAELLDDFKDQLLLALVRRLGGNVSIPVSEVDQTGGFVLAMRIADIEDATKRAFVFELRKKQ